MCDGALKGVYRAVVIARLLYASPAWWGYASTSDKQRIEAFIRRGVRLGFYDTGDPTAQQLADVADETLFQAVRYREHHNVLHHPLPDTISHRYTLSSPGDITLYLQQILMTGILLLDNCLETSVDILILFLLHSYTVISHIMPDLN